MKLIPLTKGQSTMVDDWNYDWLMQWKWYANKNRGTYYAVRSEKINNKATVILMHREIMNTPKSMVVDHINHDGLNNLEHNLRNCTESQNQRNQRRAVRAVNLIDINNYLPLHRVNADNPTAFFVHSRPQVSNLGVCCQLYLHFKYEDKGQNYKRHGLSYIKEYDTFLNMRSRCYKKNSPSYKNYGLRGIKICDKWLNNPKLFIDYVQSLPDYGTNNYSLDRIDNDGNYEPGNLRWASKYTQIINRRVYYKNIQEGDILQSNISGITWDYIDKKWRIRLSINGKRTSFGYSKTIKEAIIKKNEALHSMQINS